MIGVVVVIVMSMILLWLFVKYYGTKYNVVNYDNVGGINGKLVEYEKNNIDWHSLGNDFFYVSHGADYTRFFKRLGKDIVTTIAYDGNKIIGLIVNVKRQFGNDIVRYIGGLVVDKEYRKKGITNNLISKNFVPQIFYKKWYSIAMKTGGNIPRKLKLYKHIFLKFKKIYIYDLDYTAIVKALKHIGPHIGKYSFLSLKNTKDLILKSTNKPIKLLHLQWGPNAQHTKIQPKKGYQHMFCVMEGHVIKKVLDDVNIVTDVVGTIIGNYIPLTKYILTSDL